MTNIHGYKDEYLIGTAPKSHGRKRGLVFDPLEVFELLRDTWHNIPIPADAQFQGVAIEKAAAASYICLYYSTDCANREQIIVKPTDINLNPLGHCIAIRPQQLVDMLKTWFDGMVPNDAEATAFYINKMFNMLCIEVASEKFPDSNALTLPMLHLTYDGEKIFALDDKKNLEGTVVH